MFNLDKKYSPMEIETKWYKFWEDNGFFHSQIDKKREPYTIVIPPPNVTGVLHMGHGLNNTIQDILIRYHRMKGRNVLWLPGTDHAGIATQNVVEKQLEKEGKTRYDIGREELIKRTWKVKEEHHAIITSQLRKLGSSLDWERERFTMDQGLSNAVREIFNRLYEDGLIYQGNYIINWCPRCGTALSDEETEHKDTDGNLYYIKYPILPEEIMTQKNKIQKLIKEKKFDALRNIVKEYTSHIYNSLSNSYDFSKWKHGFVNIATTRPETMLGDTAVAINPKDNRYKELTGKYVLLPIQNIPIPVILDSYVDMEFGTGIVKITPAHDPNDFEVGKRHGLTEIIIMTPKATINNNAPKKYWSLNRFEARKIIIEDLKKCGLLDEIKLHNHAVGHCYRCDTIVEPYLSKQWFVKMKPLSKKAIEVVKKDEISFHPSKYKKYYLNWMENIRDWCISRQIWWGHRIPVWYCNDCGETIVSRKDISKCNRCGSTNIQQDADVLDTWFSSWLWPFSTLGWPEKTPELDYFYPGNVLVTDVGIIFFWVARMIMAGLYAVGRIPFKDVYIHGTVMDATGRKMSKSIGNGIDPLWIIDGANQEELTELYKKKYKNGVSPLGADALRYTVINLTPQGQNALLSIESFNIGFKFANKLWNAARYIFMNISDTYEFTKPKISEFNAVDKWMISEIKTTISSIENNISLFRLNDISSDLYEIIWHGFCDWYIEFSKASLYSSSSLKKTQLDKLLFFLDILLKLLHPVMPFITEEIYQKLPFANKSIMIEAYPSKDDFYSFPEETMQIKKIMEIIYSIRNLKAELNLSKKIDIDIIVGNNYKDFLISMKTKIISIAGIKKLEIFSSKPNYKEAMVYNAGIGYEIFANIGKEEAKRQSDRLKKELEKLNNMLLLSEKKLNNKNFIEHAKKEAIKKEQAKSEALKEKIKKIEIILKNFL